MKKTYTDNTGKKIILDDKNEINRGGEGVILSLENMPDVVAKIYHKKTTFSEKKFNDLSKLDTQTFVVPQKLLYSGKNIAGFLMEFIDSNFFPLSVLFSKNYCKKNNIDSNLKQKIANNLINALKTLHSNEIIVGDLNQFNILFNLKGEVKLIDTDSFATKGEIHSGVILDDVRDYLYAPKISKESDYFALAVIIFYMFTFSHPFKGIHAKYKSIKDRMLQKIPVFATDNQLKKPKCFMPLADANLTNMFDKIFTKGERFLISLSGNISNIAQNQVSITTKITEKDIIITPILNNASIENIYFNDEIGYIETKKEFIIYDARNRAYLTRKHIISKTNFDKIFISSENIICRKENFLYLYKNENEQIRITNFEIPKDAFLHQQENILTVVSQENMYWLFLDKVMNTSIQNQRFEVFGKSFSNYAGFMQKTGGNTRIFYNAGNNIANVKVSKNIKMLYQQKNVGVMQTVENDNTKTSFFTIKGLSVEMFSTNDMSFSHFAFMPTQKNEGLILVPKDDRIDILRTDDFAIIAELNCSFISEQTVLQYSKSGIIAYEDDFVILINNTKQ